MSVKNVGNEKVGVSQLENSQHVDQKKKEEEADGLFTWVNKPHLPKHLNSGELYHRFPHLLTYDKNVRCIGCGCEGACGCDGGKCSCDGGKCGCDGGKG